MSQTYYCYYISPQGKYHCDGGKTFFVALAVDCGSLDNPVNGFVQFQDTTLGSPAQYTCQRGYRLVGTDVRVCTETGVWSDTAPICVGKSVGYKRNI